MYTIYANSWVYMQIVLRHTHSCNSLSFMKKLCDRKGSYGNKSNIITVSILKFLIYPKLEVQSIIKEASYIH